MDENEETRAPGDRARHDGMFQFSEQLETLASGKIAVYIDVFDSKAALAFSLYEGHRVITRYVNEDDLSAWGLSYSDLVEGVEAKGVIEKSGWYPVSEKIADAIRGREAQALALFKVA
jgi:hypothetical protein